jgi:hypothetical protein
MSNALQLYYRLEERVEELPRLWYAAAIGSATCLGMLAGSLVLKEITVADAAMMGVMSTIVYYALDPR